MIKILGKIKNETTLAISGGMDSMVILTFLLNSKKKIRIAHFNHGTEHGKEAEEFVKKFCKDNKLKLVLGHTDRKRIKGESLEEYQRNCRYDFLDGLKSEVITCHHLDDAVETWVFSCLHGKPKVIPYRRKKVIRPFLLTKKGDLLKLAITKGIPFVVDPGNSSQKYKKNYIRTEVIPMLYTVNPNIHNTIGKIIMSKYRDPKSLLEKAFIDASKGEDWMTIPRSALATA